MLKHPYLCNIDFLADSSLVVLAQIRKKKSAVNQVSNQSQRPWEKLDLDFAKREQLQKEISLAEQIHFAKKKRAEQLLDKL